MIRQSFLSLTALCICATAPFSAAADQVFISNGLPEIGARQGLEDLNVPAHVIDILDGTTALGADEILELILFTHSYSPSSTIEFVHKNKPIEPPAECESPATFAVEADANASLFEFQTSDAVFGRRDGIIFTENGQINTVETFNLPGLTGFVTGRTATAEELCAGDAECELRFSRDPSLFPSTPALPDSIQCMGATITDPAIIGSVHGEIRSSGVTISDTLRTDFELSLITNPDLDMRDLRFVPEDTNPQPVEPPPSAPSETSEIISRIDQARTFGGFSVGGAFSKKDGLSITVEYNRNFSNP